MSLTPVTSESESPLSAIVDITYAANTGFRLINGVKSAIDNVTLTFCNKGSAEAFRQKVEQQKAGAVFSAPPKSVHSMAMKHSMAFIDMTLDSGDDRSIDSLADAGASNDGNTSATDMSSPLQTKGPKVARSQKKQLVTSFARPGHNLGNVTPFLKKSRHNQEFAERLRASQEDPGSPVTEAARTAHKPGTRNTQGKKSPHGLTESTTQKRPLSRSNVETFASVHEDRLRSSNRLVSPKKPDLTPSITSVPRTLPTLLIAEPKPASKKRRNGTSNTTGKEPPSKAYRSSHKEKPQAVPTMVLSISPGGDRGSRASTPAPPAKVPLKRRAIKEPARAGMPSQRLGEDASTADEYDFPPGDSDQTRPQKKTKTEGLNHLVKKALVKDTAGTVSGAQKRAASQKRAPEKSKRKHNTMRSPNKQEKVTAATTRGRRAAKTPKYVEHSDISDEEASDGASEVSTAQEDAREINDPKDYAEDSHPLSKEALEIALQASNLNLESNLQELADSTDLNTRCASVNTSSLTTAQITPKHTSKRLSEGSIPPVSEKLVRKTTIVHFGPQGPGNQAVLPRFLAEEVPESVPLEDEAPQTLDQEAEKIPSSPIIELIQGDVPEQEANGSGKECEVPTVERRNKSIIVPEASPISDSEVSTLEVSCEQEAPGYVDSEGHDETVNCSPHPRRSDAAEQRPLLLINEPALIDRGDPRITKSPEAPARRSISVGAVLDEDYPHVERVINTHKIQPSLHLDQHATRSNLDKSDKSSISKLPQPTITQNHTSRPTLRVSQASFVPGERERMGPPAPRQVPSRSTDVTRLPDRTPPVRAENKQSIVVEVTTTEMQKPAMSAPVRIKKTILLPNSATLSETDLPPATPLSFCTRLDMEAHTQIEDGVDANDLTVTEERETARRTGDASLTLIDDETFSEERRVLRTRRAGRQHAESAEDMSSITSPSRRQKNEWVGREINVRKSQHGLLDAILQITNDILFRFGEEEDAVRARIAELYRGGDDIIQTLTDSWNDRLGHEHQNLVKGLSTEKEMMAKAVQLVAEQDSSLWRDKIVSNPGVPATAASKAHVLVAQIEALRKNHPQFV
ncbi:hypothetical protein A1O3_08565 [Capronia epimyces CBS 606.96]|uniref:Uncharacterized protein n=1 Tax=Capronia epimyces CBS 606.96 TaxID=1182542 RepID=W9Y9K0_9EURO|nr:uncharacterized protein A1O3_08565 [Capronia epimyces CBS 606.96]EXJ79064.1 hypothetical protein A1O3_08565 [Capronia epimyces CBS 606.96]